MITLLLASLLGDRTWGTPVPFCTLKDERIFESSGVAASARFPGTYYTHNDSGDTARFFRFGKLGVIAEYSLKGVKAVDWEDIATATLKKRNWIFLADIGDNKSKRKNVQIYKVPEPSGQSSELVDFTTFNLSYPDGPHDCETLLVDPKTGDIELVTKDQEATLIYGLKAPVKSGAYQMSKLGSIKPSTGLGKYGRLVTSGSVDRTGKHVVLRTYSGALEYDISGSLKDWWKVRPRTVPMPLDPQGEAICYSLDGQSLITTTEGKNCAVHQVSLKK